jgi:hypothetical protein
VHAFGLFNFGYVGPNDSPVGAWIDVNAMPQASDTTASQLNPTILQPDLGVFVGGMIAAILACAGFLLTAIRDHSTVVIVLASIGGLCLACLPFAFPKSPKLSISADGVRYGRIFFVPWHDVTAIRVGWSGLDIANTKYNKWVYIDYQTAGKAGMQQLLPRIYKMTAEDLAALMMRYYEAAKQRQTTFAPSGGQA